MSATWCWAQALGHPEMCTRRPELRARALQAQPQLAEDLPDDRHLLDADVAEHQVLVPRDIEVLVRVLVGDAGELVPVLDVHVAEGHVDGEHRPPGNTLGADAAAPPALGRLAEDGGQ